MVWMKTRNNSFPTLEELVAANLAAPSRAKMRKQWPCLDGLSKKDRNLALNRLWRHLNREKKLETDRKWHSENRERSNEKKRDWYYRNHEQAKAKYRAFSKTQAGKEISKRYYQKCDKEKKSARRKSFRAIKSGRLVPEPCEICGQTPTQGHHEDYSKPYDVRWLCNKHHNAVHRKHNRLILPERK